MLGSSGTKHMDRKAIFEQALKETGSLVKAMELVKEIEGFLFFKPEDLQHKPEPKKPIPLVFFNESTKPVPHTNRAPKPSPQGHKNTRKVWKPGEVAMAEAMLNQGKSIEDVAVATDRTVKAIRNALSVNVLKPTIDPRNPKRRAASYKSVVTRGHQIRDYTVAETLLDAEPKKG
jgi:hypothetical protein